MKVSLRVTLLTILLVLLGTTVSIIGFISYRHAHFTARNLARQLLDQAMERIRAQIDNKLGQATKLSAVTTRRFQAGQLRIDDPDRFVQHAVAAMEITDDLSGYFIGYENSGESAGVSWLTGKQSIWRSFYSPSRNTYQVREYWPEGYPDHPFANDSAKTTPDTRSRPWFRTGKTAGKPVWTDSFVFLGVEGTNNVHGLSYVTPLYAKDGTLKAVLDADFELNDLCHFLGTLELGQTGFAYIVEHSLNGNDFVIAHPKTRLLMRDSPSAGPGVRVLIAPDSFPDHRVSALARHLESKGTLPRGASSATFRFLADGAAYLGVAHTLDPATNPPWTIFAVLPEVEVLGEVQKSVRYTVLIGISVIALSLVACVLVAGQVSLPLEQLAQTARSVQQLDFTREPVVQSVVSEVDHLAVAIEDMKLGLRSFRKYIPPGLFQSFLKARREAVFGGEHQVVSIFFSDIHSFTTIAEVLPPEQVVELLREYLNTVCQVIEAAGGTVDKYIGDAVMAFWQPTSPGPGHALSACSAALRCQAALDVLNSRWAAEGKPQFRTRIGLNTGEVVVGNIGSDTRFNYTIIGDAVNLSSRLERLNLAYGTRILISESTYQHAGDAILARPLDYVAVKGRRLPVLVYELVGLASDAADHQREAIVHSAEGIRHYRNREWDAAVTSFSRILHVNPTDHAANMLIERCHAYRESAPDPAWDGSDRMP
jgi:adenylate cyclase